MTWKNVCTYTASGSSTAAFTIIPLSHGIDMHKPYKICMIISPVVRHPLFASPVGAVLGHTRTLSLWYDHGMQLISPHPTPAHHRPRSYTRTAWWGTERCGGGWRCCVVHVACLGRYREMCARYLPQCCFACLWNFGWCYVTKTSYFTFMRCKRGNMTFRWWAMTKCFEIVIAAAELRLVLCRITRAKQSHVACLWYQVLP